MQDKPYYQIKEISNLITRRDYSKIKTDFIEPNLLEVQIKSYEKFLKTELEKVIKTISPIHSVQNKYTLKILSINFGEPKRNEWQARNDGKTYDIPLYVDIQIENNETGEIIKSKKSKKHNLPGVFFSNVPLMTKKGTFIINGIEKFVIAQIVRSSGAYILPKSQIKLHGSRKKVIEGLVCEILPTKGTLMIASTSKDDVVTFTMRDVSGESAPQFSAVELLKAFGLSLEEIQNIYGDDCYVMNALTNDTFNEEKIFLDTYMSGLKKMCIEIITSDLTDEQKEEALAKGHKLDYTLKKLVYDYTKLELQLNSLDDDKKNNNDQKINIKANMSSLINKIISEASAKNMVKKLSISQKVFDNNTWQIEEECINYYNLLLLHFCNSRHYDLIDAGRYKINRKLRISERLYQRTIAQDIYDVDGNVVFKKNTLMNKEQHDKFKALIKADKLALNRKINLLGKPSRKVFGEDFPIDYEAVKIYIDNDNLSEDAVTNIIGISTNNKKCQLSVVDLISVVSYASNLNYDIGYFDDIDHLGNKRLKLIHELLKSKINATMIRIEKFAREKLNIIDGASANIDGEEVKEQKTITVRQLVNSKPFQLVIKDFFNSHQLTQFIDQQNPLAELTNKRRISAMGPGGISREDPNLDIRDVHYSHYGRICPIETPEGMNIGLVMSLASFTTIDEKGFLLTPYRKVNNGVITDEITWMIASQDDEYIISEPNVEIDENNKIIQETVVARFRGISDVFSSSEIDYIDVSPKQVISIAASSIPFLENNDANRALMGANMQRQATPLIKCYSPIIGTGSEYKIAHDSGMAVISEFDGVVSYVDGSKIVIKTDDGKEETVQFVKFQKTNQNTCNNQIPIVEVGEIVKKGQTLCDGPAMKNGELALGQNILVAFTTWSGYNYEDAIILSEKLVRDDYYTSISIDEYTIKCMVTKNGDEEITRHIPNVSESAKKFLDEDGIVMVGSEVREGDILVGKTTPKGVIDISPEQKLLQSIFGEKTKPVKDSSLKLPHSGEGIIAGIKRFKSSEDDDLGDDIIEIIKIYVVQKRKIQIGDKMAGRHGNKGIISKIVPIEDMPHLKDGTPIDVMLNPLGVPSRMNIGQILEVHLGLAAREISKKELIKLVYISDNHLPIKKLFTLKEHHAKTLFSNMKKLISDENIKSEEEALDKIRTIDIEIILDQLGLNYSDISYKISTPVFDGCTRENLEKTMIEAGIDPIKTNGKFTLIDGRTGEAFDGPISVGIMYILKLDHMVDDKIHSRSVGPYSKITQQPLGGKSQNGGQRFGEMEVWALEAYGAAHNLREILTIKSDDVRGRNKTYSSIIKGKPIPSGCMPESFKLLVKQLQGLCLYTSVIDTFNREIDTSEYIKYENIVNSSTSDEEVSQELKKFEYDDSSLDVSKPSFFEDEDEEDL